jgi:alkylation response protein AidB-like acyl-CoA dehydrogenase
MREVVPGPEGNVVALYFSELSRRVNGFAFELLGASALERDGVHDWSLHYFESFKWGIGGGTNEIRRNAIAERMLGLPKSPSARDTAR